MFKILLYIQSSQFIQLQLYLGLIPYEVLGSNTSSVCHILSMSEELQLYLH